MDARKNIEATEADEDAGTARLIAVARKEIAAGIPLIPKKLVDLIADKLQRTGSSSIRHGRR